MVICYKIHGAQIHAFCNNLEGWDGVGGGREAQKRGNICIPVADPC